MGVARRASLAAAFLGGSAFLYLVAAYTLPPMDFVVHLLGAASGFAGLYHLARDPVMAQPRQRAFVYTAIGCALGTFLLRAAVSTSPGTESQAVVTTLHLTLLLAFVALPLWLLAGRERIIHGVAAGLTLAIGAWLLYLAAQPPTAGRDIDWGRVQQWVALGGAAAGAWVLAWRLSRGKSAGSPLAVRVVRRKPQVVQGWNPRTLSARERDRRLADLEGRFQRGEIPEHEYLDRRQELEG